MDNQTYAELALRTAPRLSDAELKPDLLLLLSALGLAGETGEVVEIIKKICFHGHPLDEMTRARLIKEMGDIEWYANLLRYGLNVSLEEVHAANIAKLSARYPEGFFSSKRSQNRADGDE